MSLEVKILSQTKQLKLKCRVFVPLACNVPQATVGTDVLSDELGKTH